jgi:hypothetical protein
MIVLKIVRFPSTSEGTFGIFFDANKHGEWLPFALTLERRWLNNEKGKSCIPVGEYICGRVTSPKFGDTFEIKNVKDRTEILFHKGNLDDDSHGCVLVGDQFDPIWDKSWNGWSPGIAASGKGFQEFMEKLKGQDEFKVVIENS